VKTQKEYRHFAGKEMFVFLFGFFLNYRGINHVYVNGNGNNIYICFLVLCFNSVEGVYVDKKNLLPAQKVT
jgi:hypothetical protein